EYNTLVVTTNNDELDATYDAADLSLREAIAISNSSPGLDTITFDPSLNGQTITLNMGELTVSDSVNLDGPGADKLSISGGSGATQSRVFNFGGSGANAYSLSGLTVKDGNGAGAAAGQGGAIYLNDSDDSLSIQDSVIRDSAALAGAKAGGGLAVI